MDDDRCDEEPVGVAVEKSVSEDEENPEGELAKLDDCIGTPFAAEYVTAPTVRTVAAIDMPVSTRFHRRLFRVLLAAFMLFLKSSLSGTRLWATVKW